MSMIVKSVVYVLGGTGLFAGSFLGYAFVSGHSFKDIPLLRSFSNSAPPTSPLAHAVENLEQTPVEDHEPNVPLEPVQAAKVPVTASVLGAFVLPAPFSSDELADMQARLATRLSEVEASLANARQKERVLDERERALQGRETELQGLKVDLDQRTQDLTLREQELTRDTDAANSRDQQSWIEVARFFQDGEPEELSKKLATFEPANAARILRQLDDERAIALVNALPPDKYKTFLDAYRKNPR